MQLCQKLKQKVLYIFFVTSNLSKDIIVITNYTYCKTERVNNATEPVFNSTKRKK
jgi:hypothetical protein